MKTKKSRSPELIYILLVPVLAGAIRTSQVFTLYVQLGKKAETEIHSLK
jgi:hypothetical protein